MIRESTRKKWIGKKFGRMTILRISHRDPKFRHHYFVECKCDCGTIKLVRLSGLQQGTTSSCGCYAKEQSVKVHTGNRYRRLPEGEAALNDMIHSYKAAARKRSIEFLLTRDQFKEITSLDCYYCGGKPAKIMRSSKGYSSYIYNGIDRVDNDIGYVIENCVPCCSECNFAKNKVSKRIAIKMVEFFTRKETFSSHLGVLPPIPAIPSHPLASNA